MQAGTARGIPVTSELRTVSLRRLTFRKGGSPPNQKTYFRANWMIRGFTLVEVICPKLPAAKFGKA